MKAKPVENLTLEKLSDGMLAKWSDSYEINDLCYFYKAVEIIDKTEKVCVLCGDLVKIVYEYCLIYVFTVFRS